MPCFNAEKYIEQALFSIYQQDYKNFDVIIVDGGSSDETLNILMNAKYPIKKIISESDLGPNDALNKGFNHSDGDILCWLNSDDVYLYRSALSDVAKMFESRDAHFAYGHSCSINADGYITKTSFAWLMNLEDYQKGSNIFTGSLFFSMAAWKNFGGFNLKYKVIFEYELVDFLLNNYRPLLINRHIAALRHYKGTISDRFSNFIYDECCELRGRVCKKDLPFNLRRFFSLANSGLLFEALKNKIFDKYAGRKWSDIFSENG